MKKYHVGFTLVEVLIAISLTTIAMTMAYQGLLVIRNMDQRLVYRQSQLNDLQYAFRLLERDINQMVLSNHISQLGVKSAPLELRNVPVLSLSMSSGGRGDMNALQRVTYRFQDKQLLRQTNEDDSVLILSNIENIHYRFFNVRWQNSWSGHYSILPNAVEMTMIVQPFGHISRVFKVGG